MTLRDEIFQKCSSELIVSNDYQAIAEIVSLGRVAQTDAEIGNGSIIGAIGIAAGNRLLDVIHSTPDFRHIKVLLDSGRLISSSPLVVGVIQSMVPAVLSQAEADALKSLGFVASPVTAHECAYALRNG